MSFYSEEFRQEVVDTYTRVAPDFPSASAAGQWVAREYSISLDSVRRWCAEAGAWQGYSSVKMRAMAAEIAALRAQLGADHAGASSPPPAEPGASAAQSTPPQS